MESIEIGRVLSETLFPCSYNPQLALAGVRNVPTTPLHSLGEMVDVLNFNHVFNMLYVNP